MSFQLDKLPEEVNFGRRKLKGLAYISEGFFGKVYSILMKDDRGRTRPFAVKHLDANEGSSEAAVLKKVASIPFVCQFYGFERRVEDSTALLLLELYWGTLQQFLSIQKRSKAKNLWPASKVRV